MISPFLVVFGKAVTAVVVAKDNKAVRVQMTGKTVVPSDVLTHSVGNLYNGLGIFDFVPEAAAKAC
jgi:hypothetical protein